MRITIEEINRNNLHHANQCHGPFVVDSVLQLSAENGVIRYTVVPTAPYEKRYPPNEVDYTTYIEDDDKTAYLAYADGELAGEIVIRQWWNNFAYIEDLAVAERFRRAGIGRLLVEQAIRW